MILFFALCFVGLAVAGLTALLIFWPLTLVHMRDRHPEALASFGDPAFISPWHCAGCWRGVTAATATVGCPVWPHPLGSRCSPFFSAWAWRPCSA